MFCVPRLLLAGISGISSSGCVLISALVVRFASPASCGHSGLCRWWEFAPLSGFFFRATIVLPPFRQWSNHSHGLSAAVYVPSRAQDDPLIIAIK